MEATMLRRQAAISILVGLALALMTTTAVLAKDNAVATIDSPLPPDADPRTEITVGWTVTVPVPDGSPAPFNAEAMFIRLIPDGGEPIEAIGVQDRPGHYAATVTMPAGGLRDVEFGLRGESCSNGTCERSDLVFATAVAPLEVAIPASNASPPAPAIDLPVVLALLTGIAVVAGIGATMLRAGRIEPGSTRS
jgi:hypothetical protein